MRKSVEMLVKAAKPRVRLFRRWLARLIYPEWYEDIGVPILNEEQWAEFEYNMTHPKPPTPGMIKAAEMMRELSKKQKK